MKYRRFGRTELAMPVFSCGGMRYQQSWQDISPEAIESANQANVEKCIQRALEVGINHIETARGYGSSELQLGQILSRLPRQDLIIQTKVAPASAPDFLKTFEKSLSLLQLEQVDLLSIHGVNNRSLLEETLRPGGALEAARQLQKEGRVRFIGFSTHASCDVISEAVETGEFDYCNLHWYWVNRSNWAAIEAARRHDMGVFIISPNDKGGKLYAPPEKLQRLCSPYSPMVFNDLFCLSRSEVHTLSLGVARPEDFDEHLKAVELLDQAEAIARRIDDVLQTAMAETLGEEWCRRWAEGLPPWEEVPGEVNLWEILRLWTYAKSLDMVEFGKMRYNLLGNADHWFPGKNLTEIDPEGLRTSFSGSPFADRLPGILQDAHALLWDRPKKRLSQE